MIQNIVVKDDLSFEEKINLKELSTKISNTEYNPDRFPGLFIRYTQPKCVIIFFRNGKLILMGLKSFNQIDLVIKRLIFKLNDIFEDQIDPNSIKTKIVNIVITANFYKKINLNLAVLKLDNSIYEPEVFPGLVYKTSIPIKSVFLIFSTGKIVSTGISEKIMIEPALKHLGNLLNAKDLFITS
ncbi:MAG: TATA-box-binding protein [Candidatus Lokiarchaeia archaeon]